MSEVIALKVDVDTERGTREGVPALVRLLEEFGVPATFLFSLGPDNTGKAVSRIFRPGFFKKVSRTSVVETYGVRTLLNGTLLPAPHIGRRNTDVLRSVQARGFEVGIHCYDHYRWQDHLFRMSPEQTRAEFNKARGEFMRIFGCEARTAGAPGWQASMASKQVYDDAGLYYASDCRGESAFLPRIGGETFKVLEIPTTLPTLDELLGRPEFPEEVIVPHYLKLLREDRPNVLTIHAEIEGGRQMPLFCSFLLAAFDRGCRFVRMEELADGILAGGKTPPACDVVMDAIDGRSGTVATQAGTVGVVA
ncbi:polysaccharide deacetylase family protein [Haloferula sp. BvORR071]|uniref:polysaccharide deacetylase family protein n=1 Tax=Haloferula sp. BvORR071 TaxID=1396141 RepID=UPI00054DEEDC|nr:polysaccharide deacetylase family protein [Haloferula sp. BvORR071]